MSSKIAAEEIRRELRRLDDRFRCCQNSINSFNDRLNALEAKGKADKIIDESLRENLKYWEQRRRCQPPSVGCPPPGVLEVMQPRGVRGIRVSGRHVDAAVSGAMLQEQIRQETEKWKMTKERFRVILERQKQERQDGIEALNKSIPDDILDFDAVEWLYDKGIRAEDLE